MSRFTIAVSKRSRDTLNKLSELSKVPVTKIVAEWTDVIAQIMEENKEASKVAVACVRRTTSKGNPTDQVLTLLGFLYSGRAWVPDAMSDETALKKLGVKKE